MTKEQIEQLSVQIQGAYLTDIIQSNQQKALNSIAAFAQALINNLERSESKPAEAQGTSKRRAGRKAKVAPVAQSDTTQAA